MKFLLVYKQRDSAGDFDVYFKVIEFEIDSSYTLTMKIIDTVKDHTKKLNQPPFPFGVCKSYVQNATTNKWECECFPGRIYNPKTGKCSKRKKCGPFNCERVDTSGVCDLCKPKAILFDNGTDKECIKRKKKENYCGKNCQYCKFTVSADSAGTVVKTPECQICRKGYILNPNYASTDTAKPEVICIKANTENPIPIYYCNKVLNGSTPLKCYQCQSGYVVASDELSCIKVTNTTDFTGCRKYSINPSSGSPKCHECLKGYTQSKTDGTNNVCTNNEENVNAVDAGFHQGLKLKQMGLKGVRVSWTSKTNNASCFKTFGSTIKYQDLKPKEDSFCKAWKSVSGTKTCECFDGYKLTGQNNCRPIEDTDSEKNLRNCTEKDTANPTDCFFCNEGFYLENGKCIEDDEEGSYCTPGCTACKKVSGTY